MRKSGASPDVASLMKPVCCWCLGHPRDRLPDTTWVHSYVTEDKKKTFCVYDAPSPEAIRRAARRNNLPVDQITEVRVLDPYFYR